ncbi:MAG: hypothetical protein RLZZ126_89 [Pseudomonadota bacterium]|jgi:tripartite-type tricarboxylate transporter receptor subunit TctC
MKLRRKFNTSLAAVLALAACGLAAPVAAQTFPTKQITIVAAYPPGGDIDALGRVFAEKLSARVGQPVIVENKVGASGTIGSSFVAKSAADGHTILYAPSTFAIAPLVLKSGTGAPYDPINDFAPIIMTGTASLFLVATPQAGFKDAKELVAAAKAGKVAGYGSPGSGSPMHVLGEMVNRSAGTQIKQVPYRGLGPAITDVIGGHIPFMYTTLGPMSQHVAAGKAVVLAVADPQRSPLAPNVPTLEEMGIKDANVDAWHGFFAPKGTPDDVIRTLNAHFNEIMKTPEVQARMKMFAMIPVGGAPAELAKINQLHNTRYGRAVKELNIQAD